MKKLRANTLVHSHTLRHHMDICAYQVTKICNLVNERYLGRQKSVCSVLDQLGGLRRSNDDGCFNQINRSVQVTQDGDRLFFSAADDDPIRMQEVIYRRAFAQEFRIGSNREATIRGLVLIN